MSRALLKRQAPTFSTLNTAWRTPAVTEAALGGQARSGAGGAGGPKAAAPQADPTPPPEEVGAGQRDRPEGGGGDRAQVTGAEGDGAARGGGGGGGRRRRGARRGPEHQAQRGQPGRQRGGNEKQTQTGECSRDRPAVHAGPGGLLPRRTATSPGNSGSRWGSGHASGAEGHPLPAHPFSLPSAREAVRGAGRPHPDLGGPRVRATGRCGS